MPTYVLLISWTEQGVKSAKATVERAQYSQQLAQRMGGNLSTLYWTLGSYDIVGVAEMPDDESVTALAVAIASQGNVRTETLRAFSADEMERILQQVP
ncbi:GYD domain-containing protein [Sphaerobacter thermophilus]|uniref:GYD family protein n=2 Tax=Sphaerobacter TaxID=2056 RepID=D1C1Y9_SPHTD|nr:GYD domain-containing protein [Sphaerobacter thermophilus]ACZ38256.1 GYD family protein [Sphaerobacter thermophilus DSM 20745]